MPIVRKGAESKTDQAHPLLDKAASSARQPRRLLSVKEEAAYLNVSESWLNKARCTGEGPPFYRIGRRVIYATDDSDAWLAERKRRSTSDSGAC